MAKVTVGAAANALALIQSEYPDYHPLRALARLAHRVDVMADPKLEASIHQAILPYVAPKLASVEIKDERDERRRVEVSLFEPVALPNGNVVDVETTYVRDVEEVVPVGN